MIDVAKFPNAYKEVYTILKYVDKEDVDKIPENYIKLIQSKMNKDYEFEYDENVDFENQEILRETKAIFAFIYLNFWGSNEEVNAIKQKFKQDIYDAEKEKSENYKFEWDKINQKRSGYKDIKANDVKVIGAQSKENFEKADTQLAEYRQNKWYKRIFAFIKKNFHFKNKE